MAAAKFGDGLDRTGEGFGVEGDAIPDCSEIRYADRVVRNLRSLGLSEADARAAGQVVIIFGVVACCGGGSGQEEGQSGDGA